ncbi:MAG: ATPase P [Bacteroidetes bacterium]|nr:MAG: ATPase P [Bacteroidota bacterium]PTM13820.1 MAG: ATPase P [Bacteroidota bacterium]
MPILLDHTAEDQSTNTLDSKGCYHCGEPCEEELIQLGDKNFCCVGCKTVYELLSENQLDTFYRLEATPGKTLRTRAREDYAWLDEAAAIAKICDYQDENRLKVTFHLPQIHCTSCIWLLENLYRLDEGVLKSQVNFMTQEAHLQIDPQEISLRQLVELLSRIGYAPRLQMDKLNAPKAPVIDRTFAYQLGVAGFAFGNIMLLSFPEYLGLKELAFQRWFGYLNILLVLPVLLFSVKSYGQSAWNSLRQGQLNIDVPITLGIVVLFFRSVFEIISEIGPGYLDSLAGLVFFLLIGRWFQQRTYHHLSFERNYQSYFPIAVMRKQAEGWASITLDQLAIGDEIRITNNGLLPADGVLLSGEARLDYSFVTGEADPVRRQPGERLFAGGRQTGGEITVLLEKAVSQSYLTQLWNDEAFQKAYVPGSSQLLEKIGKYFTPTVLLIALLTIAYWWPIDHRIALHAFTAVLIIACPCALALSVPFTLGNALRLLGKNEVYLKNTGVLESLYDVDAIVFDKTGTLTSGAGKEQLVVPSSISARNKSVIKSLASQSAHPISRLLTSLWPSVKRLEVLGFEELAGRGIKAVVDGELVALGSASFLGLARTEPGTWAKIGEEIIGPFAIKHQFREGVAAILQEWSQKYELYLLSGDNDASQKQLAAFFPEDHLHFQQSPHDKLAFIKKLQSQGKKVLMVGDGLNDSGALQQSEVGLVVTEDVNNFTPACDIILGSKQFANLSSIMHYGQRSIHLVYGAFVLAFIYNVIGLSFAVQGLLSPLIAAILMPLSSITIAVFGVLGSSYFFRAGFSAVKAANPASLPVTKVTQGAD